jgi:hypothetical protein
VKNTRLSVHRVPEYIVVLVTYHFRYLASAPEVRWRARAGAPALGQEPNRYPLPSDRFAVDGCLEGSLKLKCKTHRAYSPPLDLEKPF